MRAPFFRMIMPKFLALSVLLLTMLACSTSTLSLPPSSEPSSAPQETVTPLAEGEVGMQVAPVGVGYGMRGSFYDVYFTDPANPGSAMAEDGLDVPLVSAINSARLSVDLAIFNLSMYSIKNALLDAHQRGVKVRIVTDSDNLYDSTPQALKGAGIEVVGDEHEGLMHNKFMIIDHTDVWTGSLNYTQSGIYEDNNNLIRLHSEKAAQDYTTEFEEMFVEGFFGPDVIANTPFPTFTVDDTALEVYFSPDDHAANRIAQLLRSAKSSIRFMAYSFTANDFSDIMIAKMKKGVSVEGVMDDAMIRSNVGNEYETLSQAGLPVYPDANEGLMHHKVIIIDDEIVITGSYNFTSSADRKNDENVLVLFDKNIARAFNEEFQRVYAQAKKEAGAP